VHNFPNTVSPHDGQIRNILQAAVCTRSCEIIELVLGSAQAPTTSVRDELLWGVYEPNDIDVLRLLLRKFPDADLTLALRQACQRGHIDIVRELVNAGAGVHRDNLLIDAALKPLPSIVSEMHVEAPNPVTDRGPVLALLVNAGAVINPVTLDFWENAGHRGDVVFMKHVVSLSLPTASQVFGALRGACDGGNVDVAEYLLDFASEHGYEVNVPYLACRCIQRRRNDVFELLVSRYGEQIIFDEIEESGVWGEMLEYAVAASNVPVVAKLVDQYKQRTYDNDDTESAAADSNTLGRALSHASRCDVIKLLTDAHADVNYPFACIRSVLSTACQTYQIDAVKMLLGAKADINGNNCSFVLTPLLRVVNAKCTDEQLQDKISLINLLYNSGAKTRHSIVGSLLHACVVAAGRPPMEGDTGLPAVIQHIIQLDPLWIESKNSFRHTPLMNLVSQDIRPTYVAKMLVLAGADIHVRDRQGKSLIMLLLQNIKNENESAFQDTRDILRMLLHSGVDPSQSDKQGNTALMTMFSTSDTKVYIAPDSVICFFISDILDALSHPARSGSIAHETHA
jgi:ankyrin repeat protein